MTRTAHTDLISIITCVYNGERHLREAVDSVLAQTHRHWELILVDDASTDTTPAICDEYAAEDERIRAQGDSHDTPSDPYVVRSGRLLCARRLWWRPQ